MTRTWLFWSRTPEPDDSHSKRTSTSSGGGDGWTAIRIIVPLQGVAQGRGGIFLGSAIPCALFYFLQLYLKQNRKNHPDDSNSQNSARSESETELSGLPRSPSRSVVSPTSPRRPASLSGRANAIVRSGDTAYDVGLRRAEEDPYDASGNPNGIIQLGLPENKLKLDLVKEWLVENGREAILVGGGDGLSISGFASYKPGGDRIMELKVVIFFFFVIFLSLLLKISSSKSPWLEYKLKS
uniref:Acc synthase n=1 Tax=Rhizophora mucronata TaxID=61149 RepID=A0A2P2Q5N3_RHIMU